MSNIADQDLIKEFVVESLEHLADIESQLLAIESRGADIDSELVNTVFRAIHSAKGAAGFLGLNTISKLAHNMENVLNLFRNRELVPCTANIDVLLRCADVLRKLLENTETSNEADVTQYLAALNAVTAGQTPELAVERTPITQPVTEDVIAAPSSPQRAEPAYDLPSGDDFVTTPVQARAERDEEDPVTAAAPATQDLAGSATAGSSVQEGGKPAANKTNVDANIRVSVELLDDLMNLAGELVLSRNRLLQVVGTGDTDANSAGGHRAGPRDRRAAGSHHADADADDRQRIRQVPPRRPRPERQAGKGLRIARGGRGRRSRQVHYRVDRRSPHAPRAELRRPRHRAE